MSSFGKCAYASIDVHSCLSTGSFLLHFKIKSKQSNRQELQIVFIASTTCQKFSFSSFQ